MGGTNQGKIRYDGSIEWTKGGKIGEETLREEN